jgi:NADH dehydrogenase (ubiquinone) 1 alpha subcomplex subunit 1
MIPAWIEAIVPLAIIATMVAAMGGAQGGMHHLFFGKPKLVGADHWDRLLDARDARVKEEWQKQITK